MSEVGWIAGLIGAAAGAMAAGLIFIRINRRKWVDPIREIDRAVARLAGGEWSARMPTGGPPEIRHLSECLTQLAERVRGKLEDLQRRGDVGALVDALPDPIFATDSLGRVVTLNAPAARLLGIRPEQAVGQKLVSIVNDEGIVALHEAVSLPGAPAMLNREIRLARNAQRFTYQAVATRTGGGGSLLVLRDVSTLAGAAQMKTDFVANASHELRTPIAAIKIAFETLRETYSDDPMQTERCINVIDGHLRRLEEMLNDLLDLSRVENTSLQPQTAMVRTAEVLERLQAVMSGPARQKNIELRLGEYDPATPIEFTTDTHLLHLVLRNVVENSVKFTPHGGRITVAIRAADDGTVMLTVTDTGIGIAPEHIDRVFERFYQVDSARSGSAGRGTGLGLAIVKHAVHALGGTVRLESKVGEGTTITCEFPRAVPPATDSRSAVA